MMMVMVMPKMGDDDGDDGVFKHPSLFPNHVRE